MLDLDDEGDFTWDFGCQFFIETSKGNYIWSDPDYNGDNTIKKFSGTINDYFNHPDIAWGRDKGRHIIRNYCGDDVKIVE
jgi:hypothetical protein